MVDFNDDHKLTEGNFFFQSFCGAFYKPAHEYGKVIGLEDDVWITAEEWNIQRMFEGTGVDTNDTLGFASVVVYITNKMAYTVPALGQSGYEKIMPINPGHSDYVLMVMAAVIMVWSQLPCGFTLVRRALMPTIRRLIKMEAPHNATNFLLATVCSTGRFMEWPWKIVTLPSWVFGRSILLRRCWTTS